MGWTFVQPEGSGAFKYTCQIRIGDEARALKVYTQPFSERSLREVEAMRRCDHPNIARFVAFERVSIAGTQYVYLLEEFLPGGSLATRIGNLTDKSAARLALILSSAIEHIAYLGLVHRDLKPDNIMFRTAADDEPVIVDFGLVRDLNEPSLTLSFFDRGPGSPRYASPEQLNNEKELIGARTDQFGLGVTLSYVVFGRHPYHRDGEPEENAIHRAARKERPDSAFIDACVNRGFPPLVRMVQPFPIERFHTSRDLVVAWERVVQTL